VSSKYRVVLVVLFLCTAFSGSLFAQGERATISGTVTDSTGAVVPQVSISVRNEGTNVVIKTESNATGLYVAPALPPGSYEVSAQKQGFRAYKMSNIPLSVGLTATVDVRLEVGQVAEAVEVTASAVQLEAQTSGMGGTVGTKQVTELPLVGRDIRQLASLAPGVIPSRGQAGVGNSTIGSAGNSRISGGLAMQNAILMDGGDTRGFTSGGQSYTYPLEAVAEFKIQTATYSAEFGRAGGGVINVASKSGTNELHGVAYMFLRSQILNANSWSNNRTNVPKGKFSYGQFGGAMGGHIKKDKTFFFMNYEGTRTGSPASFLATVPLPAWKNGDFNTAKDAQGRMVVVYDPLTTRADPNNPGKYIRDAFPNNTIPGGRLHPISQAVQKYYPDPNMPGQVFGQVNNYYKTGKNVNVVDGWFTRLDHYIGTKHRLFGHFAGNQNDSYPLNLVDMAFPARAVSTNPTRNAGISLTSTFSPSLIGEFRVTYTRLQNTSAPMSTGFDLTKLGWPASVAAIPTYKQFPEINIQQYAQGGGLVAITYGAPEVTVMGVGQNGGGSASLNPQDTFHAIYQATWIKGRHQIKGGVDFQRMKLNAFLSRNAGGQFYFDRTYTEGPDPAYTATNSGNGYASFLLGIPISGSIETTPYMSLFQRYNSGYFQDDWRITNKLTLNIGYRYEYTSPYGTKFSQIGRFNPTGIEPTTGKKGIFEWVQAGGYHTDPNYNTPGPRMGLAYQFNQKTVIRMAGAIFNAANNGLNAAATDFGNGLYATNSVSLGAPNPIPLTPPVGGSWTNPFAAGLVIPVAGVTNFVGQNIRVDFRDHPAAYITNWNFSIQRQVSNTMMAEVAYVGSKATHLFWNRMDNAVDPLNAGIYGSSLDAQVANPYYGKITAGALSFPTVTQSQLLRPFNQYQQILAIRRPYGDSQYNSMTARVEKRYSKGYTFTVAYTLSKLIASTAESNTWVVGPSNALYDPKYNRGIEANDAPHRLVVSHVWNLPFDNVKNHFGTGLGSAVVGRMLGGWQFSGITVLQAGRPILITGGQLTGIPEFNYTNGRANRLRSGVISNPTMQKWFDTSAFVQAARYTIPTDSLSQPDLRTPWTNAWNWSFYKNNRIKERYNVQFRAEFYNLFNHPQFDCQGSCTDVTSTTFGQITEGGGNRNIQFGLRLLF
jgi:hypothetical protein